NRILLSDGLSCDAWIPAFGTGQNEKTVLSRFPLFIFARPFGFGADFQYHVRFECHYADECGASRGGIFDGGSNFLGSLYECSDDQDYHVLGTGGAVRGGHKPGPEPI